VTIAERPVVVDVEVLELLADEPELLAIADAMAATYPRRRRRRLPRLLALASALALVAVFVSLAPWQGGRAALVERALAAVGTGPVFHVVIEADDPQASVVDLATGHEMPVRIEIERWYDEERGLLRTVTRRDGSPVDELLETPRGGTMRSGPLRVMPGARGASLSPALEGFVTGYRVALESGRARETGGTTVDGREAVWLEFPTLYGAERVAVESDTGRPLVIQTLGPEGRLSPFRWRVTEIGSRPRSARDFRPPERTLRPVSGEVVDSRPLTVAEAKRMLGPATVWLGETFAGLKLTEVELQTLTRRYPPGSGREAERGRGLELSYDMEGGQLRLQLAAGPEMAYAFAGASTVSGGAIPREGLLSLTALRRPAAHGRSSCIGQLRRGRLYVTIWSWGPDTGICFEAARSLRPIPKAGLGQ
jgi:hypothetical protein